MRLQSFDISSVKSINDSGKCYLSDTDNITVLAGQNEAGKSAVLEALDFFRNGASERFTKLSVRFDKKPVVTCVFLMEDGDANHDDPITKAVLTKLDKVTLFRGADDGTKADKIYLAPDTLAIVTQEVKSLLDKTSKADNPETPAVEPVASTPPAAPAPETAPATETEQEIVDKITTLLVDFIPEFIFYDSFSDILPGEILITDIPTSRPVLDFQKIFGIDFTKVTEFTPQQLSAFKNEVSNKASLDLNDYWTQTQTTKEDDKYQFDVNINLAAAESKVEFLVHRNDGNHLFLEQKSKGFQWFNAFNLRLKALGVTKKENLGAYLILIDEPGQGLHEAAQKDVKKVLEEIAKEGAQIVYSTHNPSLIGVNDKEILRIRLVYQTRENGSKIKNLAQFSTEEGSKEALSPIITAMGASHIGQFLDGDKKIVVVEGITDHYYLAAMKAYLKVEDDFLFVPACGANNVKTLVAILLGWRQNFKAVLDDGNTGKNVLRAIKKYLYVDSEDELNKRVKVLTDFDGIEDLFSKSDFDKYVLKETITGTKKNSEVAKEKKKEVLARFFLESIDGSEDIELDDTTKNNFKEVFDWIKNGSR